MFLILLYSPMFFTVLSTLVPECSSVSHSLWRCFILPDVQVRVRRVSALAERQLDAQSAGTSQSAVEGRVVPVAAIKERNP